MPGTRDTHQPWCGAPLTPCSCGLEAAKPRTPTPSPRRPGLSDDQREQLQSKLERLGAAKSEIEAAREPFDRAAGVLQEQIDCLLEDYGLDGEPVGNCLRCERLLLPGDLGHTDAEGSLHWCEACAPTWSNVLDQYKEIDPLELVDQDPEDFAVGLQVAQARVEDGDGDKKHVWELY